MPGQLNVMYQYFNDARGFQEPLADGERSEITDVQRRG